jgi:hypothetical protein
MHVSSGIYPDLGRGEVVGGECSRTTEIYTHVGTKSLQRIRSPFDDLYELNCSGYKVVSVNAKMTVQTRKR